MARGTGNKPKYETPEQMQAVIDRYFASCDGEWLKDDNGDMVFNKFGSPIRVNDKPPTITGLALALGFTTRQSLLNYQSRKAFVDTVTRAKARCEAYAEQRLYDRDGSRGAEFSLRHNFKWAEDTADNDDLKKVAELLGGVYRAAQS